jgi:FkbM family methyltransferase
MTLRKRIKFWLYGSCPGFRGSFPYFGSRVFFPTNSLSFMAACQQGIFEHDILRTLFSQVRPDTWMFDIGANIGLMAVPVLQREPRVRVLSFEPSPNSLPSLRRTLSASPYRDRWSLVTKAVGATSGTSTFHLASEENSLFDGFRDTGRVPSIRSITVETTTVDVEWSRLGKPPVSAIKCDIEGGELSMLEGAGQCLATCRPAVLLEWNATNLAAFHVAPESLLAFSGTHGYRVHAVPGLAEAVSPAGLAAHMAFTESFLLLPSD